VSPLKTVAMAAVKIPQAGQQSQAKRLCHQSKSSASGKAVDTKGKGKQYFPPSSKARARAKIGKEDSVFLTYSLLDQVRSSL
jgi:hypothetical protein